MNSSIRDIGENDFESILEINQQSIPDVFELDTNEFFNLLELCEYSKLVEIDNEVAGYIFVLGKGLAYDGEEYTWFCENLSDEFLYIDQIAIGRKWKGMGCGKLLYKELENYAVLNRKNALVCEINYDPLNRDSMAFHKKLGFIELSHVEARGIVVSLLAKRISDTNQATGGQDSAGGFTAGSTGGWRDLSANQMIRARLTALPELLLSRANSQKSADTAGKFMHAHKSTPVARRCFSQAADSFEEATCFFLSAGEDSGFIASIMGEIPGRGSTHRRCLEAGS